jgi:hypothetical protein
MAQSWSRPRHRNTSAWRRKEPAEVSDTKRQIVLLTARLASEREALVTWELRLEQRRVYEQFHKCQSQVPQIRQECAATHARVLELERRLVDLRREARQLLARQDAK